MSKKPKIRVTKTAEEKYVGSEPKNVTLDKIGITYAYNHYNYFYTLDNAIEFFEKYLEGVDKSLLRLFRKQSKYKFPTTIGWIAKMLMSNVTVPSETLAYFNKFKDSISNYVVENAEEKQVKKVFSTYKENRFIEKLEEEHDNVVKDINYKFNVDGFFRLNTPSKIDLKKISDYYAPILEELENIPNDKDIKEGYSKVTKKELVALISFYRDILRNTQEIKIDKSRTRKVRKPKAVSVQKQLKKIRYLVKDNTLNISSISPEKILTSNCIVVYNITRRKLYVCHSPGTFKVNGVSIVNIDPEKSFSKTIRKPETVKEFLTGTKTSILKKFEELKTTPATIEKLPTTVDSLILRAF